MACSPVQHTYVNLLPVANYVIIIGAVCTQKYQYNLKI